MRDDGLPLVRDALPWLQKPLCFVGSHIWATYPTYRCCGYCMRMEEPITLAFGEDKRLIGWRRCREP